MQLSTRRGAFGSEKRGRPNLLPNSLTVRLEAPLVVLSLSCPICRLRTILGLLYQVGLRVQRIRSFFEMVIKLVT